MNSYHAQKSKASAKKAGQIVKFIPPGCRTIRPGSDQATEATRSVSHVSLIFHVWSSTQLG